MTTDGDGKLVFSDVHKPSLDNFPDVLMDAPAEVVAGDSHAEDCKADEHFWMKFLSDEARKQLDGGAGSGLPFDIMPDNDEEVESLVDASNKFRVAIDRDFGWANKDIRKSRQHKILRAATQLCVLLVTERLTKYDAKSEQLHAKIISLLLPAYRSHSEQLFRLNQGVFKRTASLTLQDLDFFDGVCKHCHAVWVALSWKQFEPAIDDYKKHVAHVIHHLPETFLAHAIHFKGDDS